ncbi:MATH domain and coiled-coil domain-containing protein At3g58280 isoform X2 [Arachis hypogaea]|uniref:MATH domain and coiled-coil domain-containing protein At3g58280 isoform X2 n=1 Tax=Arachis hypogaea TaxID=3818 RepID=UPI003B21138B
MNLKFQCNFTTKTSFLTLHDDVTTYNTVDLTYIPILHSPSSHSTFFSYLPSQFSYPLLTHNMSISFETFTWKIQNFSKQNTKNLQSKAFRIGHHKWRIRLYPLRRDVNHFSLYLMVADSLPAYGWSRNTYFKLILTNQVDANKSIVKETQQKFNGGYRSWGSTFLTLSDFYDPNQGYLVNNTCIIEAHVCVSDVPPHAIKLRKTSSSISPASDSISILLDDQETESTDGSETLTSATCRSSRTEDEDEFSDLTLKDIINLDSLGKEEASFVPLVEDACMWHPDLIQSQRNRSERFKIWAFTSLGQVLHFLKTSKVKDMDEDGCNYLKGLWEELVRYSGFNLTWLEPYVQSALGMKSHLERAAGMDDLSDNLVAIEIKMKNLREELAAAEAEFVEARKALAEARKDLAS